MTTVNVSPNMNLPVPAVSEDPGPDWATNIAACMSAIDSHNHTAGQGVPITPDAIDINDDLTFAGNNATDVRTVRFTAQSGVLTDASDNGSLYEAGVDLYYNDGAGNRVRITQSGSVTGSSGTITGLPSGTASVSYAGATFTFESATSTPATMAVGPLIIGDTVANPNTVTVQSPTALGASYAVTLPASLPAVTYPVTISATGALASSGTVLHADGTAGAPSMSFASDTNTGIYRIASDTLAITAGGTAQASVSTTAVTAIVPVLEADGSASAPSYSFSGDTNTGMFDVSADYLGFAAGGIRGLTLEPAAVSSEVPHFFSTSGNATLPAMTFPGDSNTGIYRAGADQVAVSTGGTARLTVSNTAVTATNDLNIGGDSAITGNVQMSSLELSGGGAFKIKRITITTSSSATGLVTAAHGLTLANIRAISGGYLDSSNFIANFADEDGAGTSRQLRFFASSTNVTADWKNLPTTSKTFYAVITYV